MLEKVHYKVNLEELPGAQVRELTGERTAEGGYQFGESGTGEPDGKGLVHIITPLSFDPKNGVMEIASAEYTRDALPPLLAAQLQRPPAPDMQQRQFEDVISPEGAEPSETPAPSAQWYDGHMMIRARDAVIHDILNTTRAYMKWTRNDSHTQLGGSYHQANWSWAPRWSFVGKSFKYGNNGQRASTLAYGQYSRRFFCGPTGGAATDAESIFEATPTRYYWHWRQHVWGECPHLVYFDHILERP